MKINKNIGITIGASVGSLLVGAGITSAIVIPLALEAKEGLENFVIAGKGSSSHSINGKDEINYVALGDSIAAGYNGFLAEEGNSYPEYLEASMENHGVEVNLENLAVSGYRRGDLLKQFSEPEVIKKMANADLITTTIGGNDLLAILQMFDLSYTDFKTLMVETGSGLAGLTTTTAFQKYGEQTIENDEIKERLINTLEMIRDIASGKRTGSDIFAFDSTISQANLLASLKKQYMEHAWWINRISDATHVYVAAPNPFASYPQDLLDSINSRIEGGYTIASYYDHLMNTITSNVTNGYDDKNINWSHSVQIDSPEYKELWSDQIDNEWDFAGTYAGTTIDGIHAGSNSYVNSAEANYVKNPLANISDIHPSMYGYELMGEAVFEKVAGLAGVKIDETKIQRSDDYIDGTGEWERTDENPELFQFTGDADHDLGVGTRVTTLDGFNSFLTLSNYTKDEYDFSQIDSVLVNSINTLKAADTEASDFLNSAAFSFKMGLAVVLQTHLGFSKP